MLARLAAFAVAAFLAINGCRSDRPRAQFISIATGGTGGVWYPYGGGLAKVLNESLPGIRASAEVSSGAVDNLKLIRDGRADIAFTLADALADAVGARGAFAGAPAPAVGLAVLYSNYTHLVTLSSSGINTVADLRDRRVSTGAPGSQTDVIGSRVLRASGIDPQTGVTRQRLGASESADSLKDGKIDAFFWSGGLPTPAVQDLSYTPGIFIRMIPTGDLVPALQREHGDLYFPLSVPAGVYRGVAAPISVIGVANVLVVNRSMPEQLAYDITRVLFERQPTLATIHPEARHLSLQTAARGSPAPFHPGAIRYYREKGIPVQP